MNLSISNILTGTDGRWYYRGVVTHNTKTLKVSGTVPNLRTQGMIKRAIIEDVKRQVLAAIAEKSKTKILTPDDNFVDAG